MNGTREGSVNTSTSSNPSGTKTSSTSSNANEEEEPFLTILLKNIVLSATTYLIVKAMHHYFNSSKSSSSSTMTKHKNKKIYLDYYEEIISQDIIQASQLDVTFDDIGGMDDTKQEIWDLVVLPFLKPHLFQSKSSLVSFPRGILLYGSPGTGKTLLAKAIAKESHASFINVRLSSIFDKYFGESNKLIAAIFSLARKMSPSIIFIDEIDSFLSQRGSSDSDHGSLSSIRSEFLTCWDGLNTSDTNDVECPIMVLGATNRPFDVDEAILRRLPRTFEVDLPDRSSRLEILKLILRNQDMTSGAKKLLPSVAEMTNGYSGSDLKELCRCAAMEPIREYTALLRQNRRHNSQEEEDDNVNIVRGLNEHDFAKALKKVKKTGESARLFQSKKERNNGCNNRSLSLEEITRGVEVLQRLMNDNRGDYDIEEEKIPEI